MEESEDDITLKSLSEEALYELADESITVSNKCIFAR